jgi:hypothetical protein
MIVVVCFQQVLLYDCITNLLYESRVMLLLPNVATKCLQKVDGYYR